MSCSRTQHSDAGEAQTLQAFNLESSTLPLSLAGLPLVIRDGICKMLVRIANREDPDQTASSEAV